MYQSCRGRLATSVFSIVPGALFQIWPALADTLIGRASSGTVHDLGFSMPGLAGLDNDPVTDWGSRWLVSRHFATCERCFYRRDLVFEPARLSRDGAKLRWKRMFPAIWRQICSVPHRYQPRRALL